MNEGDDQECPAPPSRSIVVIKIFTQHVNRSVTSAARGSGGHHALGRYVHLSLWQPTTVAAVPQTCPSEPSWVRDRMNDLRTFRLIMDTVVY